MRFALCNWHLRITDIMQRPVYGIETCESSADDRLATLFQRQRDLGNDPEPVRDPGRGGSSPHCPGWGRLNIRDMLRRMRKALDNPLRRGTFRIFTQIEEALSVNKLARWIQQGGERRGHAVRVELLANPRSNTDEHCDNPTCQGLRCMGMLPHALMDEVVDGIIEVVEAHRHGICDGIIFRGIRLRWAW